MLLFTVITLFAVSLFGKTNFVCIGNSISQGKGSYGIYNSTSIGDSLIEMSYRFWLWEKLDSTGLDADFVGYYKQYFVQSGAISQKSRYTGRSFPMNHEAYYGITSDGFLKGGWSGMLPSFDVRLNYAADVALIHLGTNDKDEEVLLSENNIKTIISKLRGKNPNVTILLARLMTDWKKISSQIPRIAQEVTTENSIVYCVDMATGFINDPNNAGTMTLDWVHPNAKGQKLMAQRWFDAYMKISKIDNVAPSVPLNVRASNVTQASAMVSWTASTDNTGVNVYKVFVNDVFVGETGKTSLEINGQDFSVASVIKVSAVDYQKNESEKSIGYNVPVTKSCAVTFAVKDIEGKFLQGARTILNSVTKTTNSLGETIYDDVNTNTHEYSVINDGFNTVKGTAEIVKDTTINIVMEKSQTNLSGILSDIKIYPQPASDYLNVDGASGSFVEFIDLFGRKILTVKINSDHEQIDIKALIEGYYLVNIHSGTNVQMRKVVVRR